MIKLNKKKILLNPPFSKGENLKYKITLVLFGLLLPVVSFAASQTQLPLQCKNNNYRFQQDQLILSTQDSAQHLFLLHNRSTKSIFVNHEKIPPSASAGWASQLDPTHWSAMATQQKDFAISCSSTESGHFAKLSCRSVLTACVIPNAAFPKNLQNMAFWVAENKERKTIIPAVKKRRIYFVYK